MSRPETDTTEDDGDGKKPVKAGTDGASSDASGYRRDDYWRQEQEGLAPDAESNPAHGHDYDEVAERQGTPDAEAYQGDDGPDRDDSTRTDTRRESGKPPHAG